MSGIRGTIGGKKGENLTPADIVNFVSAYAGILHRQNNSKPLVVIGRDGRISGNSLSQLVSGTLTFCGIDVIDCGLSTTPSVEMAVLNKKATGGIICTASHNSREWNALKFLDSNGEFISAELGLELVQKADVGNFHYSDINEIGTITTYPESISDHVEEVLRMDMVRPDLIRSKKWKVCVDAINSTGSIAIPLLLEKLGVKSIVLNGADYGNFAHDPEPLPKNMKELSKMVQSTKSDLGVAVDPDVDRLVLVCEDGSPFGEEFTLVVVGDYYLTKKGAGNTVSNLSSSMALKDITEKHGGKHFQSAVGERHVVDEMKKRNALIGGEGNGGIICPELHHGRDAVAGLAVFLSWLALSNLPISKLRARYPNYAMAKEKVKLNPEIETDTVIKQIKDKFSDIEIDERDGLKLYFNEGWVHIRKSNTEPILRVYAEATGKDTVKKLTERVISTIYNDKSN